jgi:hypothetical protein
VRFSSWTVRHAPLPFFSAASSDLAPALHSSGLVAVELTQPRQPTHGFGLALSRAASRELLRPLNPVSSVAGRRQIRTTEPPAADVVLEADRGLNISFNGDEANGADWPQNDETKPIVRPEA